MVVNIRLLESQNSEATTTLGVFSRNRSRLRATKETKNNTPPKETIKYCNTVNLLLISNTVINIFISIVFNFKLFHTNKPIWLLKMEYTTKNEDKPLQNS